jgi:hypothetical protein
MSPSPETFPHRPNEDGTYDSICPVCVRTVARGMTEAKLVESELLHKCPGFRKDWLSVSIKNPRKSIYPQFLALFGAGRELS